jgi:hypothetical protein
MVLEKSFGLGDMLHETVADAKLVASCVIWLGIDGNAGAECNNCGSSIVLYCSAMVKLVVVVYKQRYCIVMLKSLFSVVGTIVGSISASPSPIQRQLM